MVETCSQRLLSSSRPATRDRPKCSEICRQTMYRGGCVVQHFSRRPPRTRLRLSGDTTPLCDNRPCMVGYSSIRGGLYVSKCWSLSNHLRLGVFDVLPHQPSRYRARTAV